MIHAHFRYQTNPSRLVCERDREGGRRPKYDVRKIYEKDGTRIVRKMEGQEKR